MKIFDEIAWRVLMVTLVGLIIYTISEPLLVGADQPHYPMGFNQCACEELKRIRMLLEHQFGLICDQTHCEGSSSSSGGGPLP